MIEIQYPTQVLLRRNFKLIQSGTDDTLITPAEIEATGRAYNAPVKIFPHMAHDLMLEQGWRDVADCILQWLDQ